MPSCLAQEMERGEKGELKRGRERTIGRDEKGDGRRGVRERERGEIYRQMSIDE